MGCLLQIQLLIHEVPMSMSYSMWNVGWQLFSFYNAVTSLTSPIQIEVCDVPTSDSPISIGLAWSPRSRTTSLSYWTTDSCSKNLHDVLAVENVDSVNTCVTKGQYLTLVILRKYENIFAFHSWHWQWKVTGCLALTVVCVINIQIIFWYGELE